MRIPTAQIRPVFFLALLISSLTLVHSSSAQLVPGWLVYSNAALNGELYVPTDYTPTKTYPVVVFLHGTGEAGSDNKKQVQSHISNLIANAGSRDFLLYAPQTNRGGIWSDIDDLPAINKILGRMTTQYSIDPTRMYVTGLSGGGEGTNYEIDDFPHLFAAFVPLSASGYGVSGAAATTAVGLPIWYYHGNADTTVTVENSRGTVNNILAAQGHAPLTSWASSSVPTFNFSYNNLHYTEYNGAGHSDTVWNNGAYNDSNMYNWMLAQKNTAITKPAINKPIMINFSADLQPYQSDTQHRQWNNAGSGTNTGYIDPQKLDVTVPFAINTTGTASTAQMAVSKTFYNYGNTTFPSASTAYDSFITQSYWMAGSSSGASAQLTFTGLAPGGTYDMNIFASIADNDSGRKYIGNYSANGVSGILDGSLNNLGGSLELDNILADSTGSMVLNITPTNGSHFAVINALTLTAVIPEPSTISLLMLGSSILVIRRRRV